MLAPHSSWTSSLIRSNAQYCRPGMEACGGGVPRSEILPWHPDQSPDSGLQLQQVWGWRVQQRLPQGLQDHPAYITDLEPIALSTKLPALQSSSRMGCRRKIGLQAWKLAGIELFEQTTCC